MKCRLLSLALALSLLLTLLGGCGETGSSTLRVALGTGEESLDPAYTSAGSNATVLLHLYDNLMRLEADGNGGTKLVSGAASSYEMIENYDGTVSYRFSISPEATWSDGTAVTAGDFVYAWQRLISAAVASPHAGLLSMVSGYEEAVAQNDPSLLSVKAESDSKLLVTLAWHCPYFLRSVCTSAATMPLRNDVIDSYGEDWSSNAAAMVSNGAYTLESWTVEDGISLTRRDSETNQGPETICFLPVEDASEADRRFTAGEADFVSPLSETAYLRVSDAPDFTAAPLASTVSLVFGSLGKCADATLRRALFLAVDYDAVRQQCADEPAELAGGVIPSGILTSEGTSFRELAGVKTDRENENYSFRLETASELLSSMEELPETVRLLYPAQNSSLYKLAECVAATWRSMLGLSVELLPLEEATLSDVTENGGFDCALICEDSDITDAMSFFEWFGGTDAEGNNRVSEGFTTLIDITKNALDAKARDSYLRAAEDALLAEYAVVPLLERAAAYEKGSNIHNIASDGLGSWLFHSVSID